MVAEWDIWGVTTPTTKYPNDYAHKSAELSPQETEIIFLTYINKIQIMWIPFMLPKWGVCKCTR